MERIVYRKTLDVHKNGIQFMLQGFETADKLSRVIEISLMASGDAIDFPLERVVAMMYVTSPGAKEPSINKCIIEDNKIVYDVLPITEEGITTMQIKIIETSVEGATSVIASPKFAVEVTESDAVDDGEELKANFSAIEDFIAKADAAYGSRLERIELASDCIFKAYYADGSEYETDVLQKLFLNGNVLLSESFAHGGTGVRTGEDTDNSMYYSNVSKSEALKAKDIMENSEEILEEVRLHGVYTVFSVDFETGDVEYVSPSFKFKINPDTGELDTEGQSYSFDDEISRVVVEWLEKNGVSISNLEKISNEHGEAISELQEELQTHKEDYDEFMESITPIEKGGTGTDNAIEAVANLGASHFYAGTYEGDGGYGSEHPNMLSFDFQPKIVFISNGGYVLFLMKDGPAIELNYVGSSYSWGATFEGNSVSWAVNDNGNAYIQFNEDGITYHYYAFG